MVEICEIWQCLLRGIEMVGMCFQVKEMLFGSSCGVELKLDSDFVVVKCNCWYMVGWWLLGGIGEWLWRKLVELMMRFDRNDCIHRVCATMQQWMKCRSVL
jgi:hypothetical protein